MRVRTRRQHTARQDRAHTPGCGTLLLVSTVCYTYRDAGYTRRESASVLGLGHNIKDIVEAKITPTITHHNWVPGAGTVTYEHGTAKEAFSEVASMK